MIHNITYFFKRKYNQICRVIDFLPIIWNGFDFDYLYATELFKHQLKRQVKFMESDKARTMNAKQTASKIQTAIDLMEKVEDEYYGCEWQDQMKELFGETVLDWDFHDLPEQEGYSSLHCEYEKSDNVGEVKETQTRLFLESVEKQKRAHRILWKFIEHNIQNWWD